MGAVAAMMAVVVPMAMAVLVRVIVIVIGCSTGVGAVLSEHPTSPASSIAPAAACAATIFKAGAGTAGATEIRDAADELGRKRRVAEDARQAQRFEELRGAGKGEHKQFQQGMCDPHDAEAYTQDRDAKAA